MDNPPSSEHILLVSDDSFVQGLVRGYCLANRLDLEVRRTATGVNDEDTGAPPRAIIVDSRKASEAAGERPLACTEMVHTLSRQARAPLCLISDSADALAGYSLQDYDRVIGEPLAEQLDDYLRKYTGTELYGIAERRHRNRRGWPDRRWGRASRPPSSRSQNAHQDFANNSGVLSVGPFAIDAGSRTVSMNDRPLDLSSKEFQLFRLLASNAGQVQAADAIIHELWPENSRANKSDLYQYVHLLRRKIEQDPQRPRWLVTVKGIGYRLHSRASGTE